ncbi:MAG: CPBP family intramembrane metalloprotease [Gemmatimonadaceae bacterium]|nr:CPBP family intramembrane metalloprotease [Gemmatimonadaceae bacterium]
MNARVEHDRTSPHAYREATVQGTLLWAAVAVWFAEFVLIPMRSRVWFPDWPGTINPFLWWTTGLVASWVIVPAIILRREGPLPFSIALPRTMRGIALYGAIIAIMAPAVYIASLRGDFTNTYPLFKPIDGWSWPLLLGYWTCYAAILFCTEFFFRGVLLFSLESRLGLSAIGVSVIPYCLIHAHKPLPEAFGSIIAGLVLGWLALRTRSIGGGVLVHCAVAIGMDALALIGRGGLPA